MGWNTEEKNRPKLIRLFDFQQRRQRNQKWTTFSSNSARITGYFWEKKKHDPYITPYTKIIFRWIIRLNVKAQTIKLSGGNIGGYFSDLRVGKGFLEKNIENNNNRKKVIIENKRH